MGFQTALGSALYAKLTTTAGTALWAARVFDTLGTQGVALPYVVYQHVAGGDTNISPSRIIDCDYRVECIAATIGQARAGADYIENALRDITLTVTGFSPIACTQRDFFNRVDNVEGQIYFRKGAFFRIRQSA